MKQSTTVNTPQHNPKKQRTSNIRFYVKVISFFCAILTSLLYIAILISGVIASAATGPFALLLVPIVLIVSAIVVFACCICMGFFISIIHSYADTVDNIQTITNIIVNEHNLKSADENKNSDVG